MPNPIVDWETVKKSIAPFITDDSELPRCITVIVPKLPPLNNDQAKLWSERYWPCSYNPASQVLQDAPPIHQIRKIQAQVDTPRAETFLHLANTAADSAAKGGYGRAIGAVVVDPSLDEVVAVAGDARWLSQQNSKFVNDSDYQKEGRPDYHALMRVIAMVANKELKRRLSAGSHTKFSSTCSEVPSGHPLNDLETQYAHAPYHLKPPVVKVEEQTAAVNPPQPTKRSEGYLCSNLDLYLTHEPCVCCAMAMIHSRFRTCTFLKRMPQTGSLGSENKDGGLGYGLFWRRELNWRVMTFQYKAENTIFGPLVCADVFNA